MTKQIYIDSKTRKELAPILERERAGQILMEHGAKMYSEAKDELWKIIKEKCPKATKLDHPQKGKWSVIIDELTSE